MGHFSRMSRWASFRLTLGLAAVALCVPLVRASRDDPPRSRVGQAAPAFALKDLGGKVHDLESLRGKKAVVVVFIGNGCPLVKQYIPRLNELDTAYRYSDEATPQLMRTHGIANALFVIPPGAKNHEVKASIAAPADVQLWSLMPHMHLRGKDVEYRAVYPDGSSEVLLFVPRWDFNWQTTYRLTEPKTLPKGTRVEVVCHYDNSADNPNNPNPNESVRFGEPTDAEMMIGFVDFTVGR